MNDAFKALSDPTRRRILELLSEQDLSAGEIADAFDISKPSISHHLSTLKNAGLILDERKGQNIIYSLNMTVFQDMVKWFFDFSKGGKEHEKSRIFLAALCILSFVGHLLVYPQLPETVPTHWGLNGEVNGWSSKPTLLFLSLLPLLLLVLLEVVPKIDPRGQNYKKHEKAYDIMILMTTLLMIGVSWISTAAALGYPVKVEQWVPLGIGLLFLALGNYMPQIRPNYTFGIKTPWTIENEWVWKKTHACGGILFCIMGVLMILSGFFTTRWLATLSLVFILGSVFWLFLYSYLLYRKWLRGESNK